jgi:hypothetical protein
MELMVSLKSLPCSSCLAGLSMGPWDMFALPVAGLENLVQSAITWYFMAFVAVSPVT